MKYLLDTNTCVEYLRGNVAIAKKINEVGFRKCAISEITSAELMYGDEYGRMRGINYMHQGLEQFLDVINIIPISECLPMYAYEKARLRKAGTPVGDDFDLLIGCTSVKHRMVMVTDNLRHFQNIRGISVENWIERN